MSARTPAAPAEPVPTATSTASPGRIRTLWNGVVAAIGVVMGLLPHLLHHIGFLAGTAVVAGAGGTALFAVLGLAASVPFLLKLYRRFGTWVAPAVALVVFAGMFAVSAFVLGPAINGADPGPVPARPAVTGPATTATELPADHSSHHP